MSQIKVFLKPKEDLRIRRGESFVYSNEIDRLEGKLASGEVANVYDSKNQFIGKGFLNT